MYYTNLFSSDMHSAPRVPIPAIHFISHTKFAPGWALIQNYAGNWAKDRGWVLFWGWALFCLTTEVQHWLTCFLAADESSPEFTAIFTKYTYRNKDKESLESIKDNKQILECCGWFPHCQSTKKPCQTKQCHTESGSESGYEARVHW